MWYNLIKLFLCKNLHILILHRLVVVYRHRQQQPKVVRKSWIWPHLSLHSHSVRSSCKYWNKFSVIFALLKYSLKNSFRRITASAIDILLRKFIKVLPIFFALFRFIVELLVPFFRHFLFFPISDTHFIEFALSQSILTNSIQLGMNSFPCHFPTSHHPSTVKLLWMREVVALVLFKKTVLQW